MQRANKRSSLTISCTRLLVYSSTKLSQIAKYWGLILHYHKKTVLLQGMAVRCEAAFRK